VSDEDHRLPARGEFGQYVEQVLDFLWGEHGRRLVEDQHVGVAVQRLQDLHALTDAHREVTDDGVWVDVETVLLGQLVHLATGPFPVDDEPAQSSRLVPQGDVLGDGHRVHEREVLVDHPDAGGDGVPRRVELPARAVDDYVARGRLVQPVEDVHQRGLAGTVLPEQRVDGAALDGQVDVVVGEHTRKPLRDPLQFDGPVGHSCAGVAPVSRCSSVTITVMPAVTPRPGRSGQSGRRR
jgi:hypothetical protein